MSAATLVTERNSLLTDRYDVAESVLAFEWLEAVVEEKAFLVAVLREIVREQRPVATAQETLGRLHTLLGLLDMDVVDVASVRAAVRAAVRALGGAA